jgi:hypothetical protein
VVSVFEFADACTFKHTGCKLSIPDNIIYDRGMTSNCKHSKDTGQIQLNIISAVTIYVYMYIRVITKLPNSEQSYKEKVKTHKYINTCYAYSLMSYDGQIILSGMVSLQPMCLHEHQINILVLL